MKKLVVYLSVSLFITGSLATPIKNPLHRDDIRNHDRSIEPLADVDDTRFRLPEIIIPKHYDLDLTLEKDVFTTNTFSGTVSIHFNVAGGKSTKNILIHAKALTIKEVSLIKSLQVIDVGEGPYISDPETDILNITSTKALINTLSEYILTIKYTGILSETSMSGFYKSAYEEDGKVKYLATTQFESGDARKAFPCFDEPQYKATFSISISHPKDYNALGNTPIISQIEIGDLKTVDFEITPKMPTYLIAFIVSEFTCAKGNDVEEGVPSAVCSRLEVQETRSLAVDVAPKLLNIMEDYTGFIYGDSHIGKMDEVAIPDFSAGAMENWGLVTYREIDVLFDNDNSSNRNKQTVVTVVSHEFSHQWFGDLVTLKWWSDIFLNEGFATYFEYYAADQIYPNWELTQQFVVEVAHAALSVDASPSSKALSYNVYRLSDVSNRFDTISYDKGGTVLRMVHHILTLDHFKAGLKDYISANQFSNTEPADLWTALSEHARNLPQGVDFITVMDNWTNKAGYPVISVKASDSDVILSQKRYLYSGEDDTQWYVPITYAVSKTRQFDDTTVQDWLVPKKDLTLTDALVDSNWIVLNVQQTSYYRVDYDDSLWNAITEALKKEDHDNIHVLNRAQIVDDIFNFAVDEKRSYELLFNILGYLKNETEYYPWYPAFVGFNYFLKRVNNNKLRTALKTYISDSIVNLYESTPIVKGTEEDQIYTLKQILAYNWACKLGQQECVDYATQEFEKFRTTGNKPNRNLRGVIYCNALRYSTEDERDWDFLWDTFTSSEVASEKGILLTALGCTRNVSLLTIYLGKVIEKNSAIRLQDARSAFSAVYSGNTEGIEAALQFIIKRHRDIVTYFGGNNNLLSLMSSVADRFTNIQQVNEFETFVETGGLAATVQASARNYVTYAKANLVTTRDLEKQLNPILLDDEDGSGSGHTIISSFTMLLSSLVIVFISKMFL